MTVYELSREQLTTLKGAMLTDRQESVSWGELAAADELVTDAAVFEEYEGTEFCEEDFLG